MISSIESLFLNFRMSLLTECCLFNTFVIRSLWSVLFYSYGEVASCLKNGGLSNILFLVLSFLKGGDPMNTLFVGIDVSTKNNQVCAVNFNQDVFFNLSFPNNPDGCDLLITSVLAFVDIHTLWCNGRYICTCCKSWSDGCQGCKRIHYHQHSAHSACS